MKIRPWAKVTSSLPSDEIETEDGRDFVQYGGKSVAEAIAEDLRALGCTVETPTHAHEHGWECSFEFEGRHLRFQVTLIDDYYLFLDDGVFLRHQWAHPTFAAFMRLVGPTLRRDDRLENLRWYVHAWGDVDEAQDPIDE